MFFNSNTSSTTIDIHIKTVVVDKITTTALWVLLFLGYIVDITHKSCKSKITHRLDTSLFFCTGGRPHFAAGRSCLCHVSNLQACPVTTNVLSITPSGLLFICIVDL